MIVVAAVIEQNGKILVCQRRRGARHEFKWEFPGGKVEPGEDLRSALERELREELTIEAEIGTELSRYQHSYAGKFPILLVFYGVTRFVGTPKNVVFETIEWSSAADLLNYDFLDGDLDFVSRLARTRKGDSGLPPRG